MGKALAHSVRHHDEEENLAVVTDRPEELSELYDHVIPVDHSFGDGVAQKLNLDHYTPYEETLFVDSDCLFYGPTGLLWEYFGGDNGFGVRSWGPLSYENECQGVADFDWYLDHYGLDHVHNIKGGFYYFDNSSTAADVFDTARVIYQNRDFVGLTSFKNAPVADEVVIATAMEICNAPPVLIQAPDQPPVNTFLGRIEPVDINVLKGESHFIKNGTSVAPTAIHYGIGTQDGYCYLRDVRRLELKGGIAAEWRARATARSEAASRWVKRKWQNIEERTEEVGPLGVLPGRLLRRLQIEGPDSR
ncbi:hypothetical protein GGP84_003185 [Salinibacter ruber]|nr:hypothetical protein [Salinibacter ruber]